MSERFGHTEALYAQKPPGRQTGCRNDGHETRLFETGVAVKEKTGHRGISDRPFQISDSFKQGSAGLSGSSMRSADGLHGRDGGLRCLRGNLRHMWTLRAWGAERRRAAAVQGAVRGMRFPRGGQECPRPFPSPINHQPSAINFPAIGGPMAARLRPPHCALRACTARWAVSWRKRA